MSRLGTILVGVCCVLLTSSASLAAGRLVYMGLDPSSDAHASRSEARILAGNAARWTGGSNDPIIAFVEGTDGFGSQVGVRLAQAGLSHLTEISAASLAAADLTPFDVLYLGPTTVVADFLGAAANIQAFVDAGGGLVVEPNVFDSQSWAWVPFADQIGHSGATNVGTETVSIVNSSHPVMQGLTGAGLSNWGFSVHTDFSSPEAADFDLLTADLSGTASIIAREGEVSSVFDNGRLVYIGLDPTDIRHSSRIEAPILVGNAVRWVGRGDDPRIGYIEGGGQFVTEVGARLAEAGLNDLTEIDVSSLAETDLSQYEVLYLGPTTEVADYVAAEANILAFGDTGGGLVVEPNVVDPQSWSWVPFANQIGHSGATNVGTESVSILVPNHPVMNGLTEDGLSNWNMSVHSTFLTSETIGFDVLAVEQLQFGAGIIIAREAPAIFADGFESGDTTTWAGTLP